MPEPYVNAVHWNETISQNLSLSGVLIARADHAPDSVIISSSGRSPLTNAGMLGQLRYTQSALNSFGIGRGDIVAIILPSSPEMLVAFLTLGSCAACLPLNPEYGAAEFNTILSDVETKAIILPRGVESLAKTVAIRLGILVIELSPTEGLQAGTFTLHVKQHASAKPLYTFAEPHDIALMLQTSGTTSKPKIVPLSHENLCRSGLNLSRSLKLTPEDKNLHLMPMFHTNGLVISVMPGIMIGGSVACPTGFDPTKFLDWLLELRPTWYTASPTIHHAILDQVELLPKGSVPGSLRMIRTSSAPMPRQLRTRLENAFGIPVIDGYGMTECASITSNPLPLRKGKEGSVGVPSGPEVAILDETGSLQKNRSAGEIVIRGSGMVMQGYFNNQEANRTTFFQDWFRTGDIGFFDDDGYLFLTGRIKETINRGGEKILPLEVDEVIMDHPAVDQAITFGIPHPRFGEDLAAAIVLKKNATITPLEIRKFVSSRLIHYKIPTQIFILDELPKGQTGKLLRLGLAEKLGLVYSNNSVQDIPAEKLQNHLIEIWKTLLKRETVNIDDNFFGMGGDSILATQLLSRIQQQFQIKLPLSTIFERPTIEELCDFLQNQKVEQASSQTPVRESSYKSPDVPFVTIEGSGAGIVDQVEVPIATGGDPGQKELQFSLFFFSADGSTSSDRKYQLLMDSARFADINGFAAIWTPERHFHPFGGLYPNPSVLGAAIATITKRIQIRAGSVVLPLQNPIRVAEEWSVVDNLSGGRVGIACASGWHANDFVLSPGDYSNRRKIMMQKLEILQKLWAGDIITLPNAAGKDTEVRIFPRPIQQKLPIWLSCHSDETIEKAGEIGANILTVIWESNTEEIARRIALYRKVLAKHGHDPEKGTVTLMMHTFVSDNVEEAREIAKSAYRDYLFVNLTLQKSQFEGLDAPFSLTDEDRNLIVSRATDELIRERGLIGTPEVCLERINTLKSIGVDEIACLIDYGIDFDAIMSSLTHLNQLKKMCNPTMRVGQTT